MSDISGCHAHVCFDADRRDQAQELCETAGKAFPLVVRRLHEKPVGPHPRGSCQLAFGADLIGAVLP